MASDMIEKIDGAVRGLTRLKLDFEMRGANATTIERANNLFCALRTAIIAERERAEKAEETRERARNEFVARILCAEASLAEAKRLLKVFADAAQCLDADIPDLKDTRGWTFQAIDIRAAARFLAQEEDHG